MATRMMASIALLIAFIAQNLTALPVQQPKTYSELPPKWEAQRIAQAGWDATDDETGYDVLHYNIEIRFDPSDESVSGHVDMLFASTEATLTQVAMHLESNMDIDNLEVDGTPTTYTHSYPDNLTIDLPQSMNLGDSATVSIDYHGFPLGGGGLGALSFSEHMGVPIISSLSEPEGARLWWPCKDIPSEKSTARMVWTVPGDLYATGNGLLQSVTSPEPGWRSYEWLENYPITSYLIAVTATNFAYWQDWYVTTSGDSLPLDYYIYPEDSALSLVDFADLPDVIAFFASVFGEYPYMDEKYGHAAFPFGGAMEHQTLTSYGASLITGTNAYHWIMVHELSHQWWGDLVTCGTWMDIWLNEGFAVYCDALWIEYDEGWQAFQNRMNYFKNTYFQSELGWQGRFPIYDPEYMWGGTVYEKGSWIMHMIRYVLGEEDFWDFFLEWRDRYAFDAAVTADLQQTLEDVSGEDLDWFFDEWVYMAGYPEYEWGWQSTPYGADSSIVDVSITQVQSMLNQTPLVFTMPVEIGVTTTVGEEVHTLWNDQREQNFSFMVAGTPTDVEFDPDNWILKTAEETGYVFVPTQPTLPGYRGPVLGLGPNPANPNTQITFSLSSPQQVTLSIYNLMGQKIATLVNGIQPAGLTQVNWDGGNQASGIYLVRLETPTERITRKLTILK